MSINIVCKIQQQEGTKKNLLKTKVQHQF